MQRHLTSLAGALAVITLAGCATTSTDHLTTDSPRAQIFEGMGTHARSVTTTSPEARAYFDQGLAWMYAFNHDEAIRSFARAAELDPECAMAWWGVALCEGPNYNDPVMTEERSAAAWGALQEARARIDNTSPLERALIEALSERYAKPWPEDRSGLEQAYWSSVRGSSTTRRGSPKATRSRSWPRSTECSRWTPAAPGRTTSTSTPSSPAPTPGSRWPRRTACAIRSPAPGT